MSKRNKQIRAHLEAQRWPDAEWLWAPRWTDWQKSRKPGPAWLAIDCGLLTDPRKRAVWEPQGEAGLVFWLHLLVTISRGALGPLGLIWGDRRMLQREMKLAELPDLEWLLCAGWLVYLTEEQKRFVEQGATLDDLCNRLADEDKVGGDLEQRQALYEALSDRLTQRWGEPRQSRRSEARYWRPFGKPGCQVRLAWHASRRAKDTAIDLIIGHDASDITIPFPEPVDPDWIVAQVVKGLGDGGEPGAAPAVAAQPSDRPPGPGKADPCAQRAQRTVDGSPENPASQSKTGDNLAGAQKQDRTGQRQYRTETGQDHERPLPGPNSARATTGCRDGTGQHPTRQDGDPAGQGTAPARPPDAPQGRQPANPHQPGARQGQAVPAPRAGPGGPGGPLHQPGVRGAKAPRRGGPPASVASAVRLVWADPDALALGHDVFAILWPGRPTGSDDAKSEVASFGSVWIREIKARLPSSDWPAAREKALQVARDVARKHKGARRKGASFLSLWRKRR